MLFTKPAGGKIFPRIGQTAQVWTLIPITGALVDVCGVISETMSTKTVNANRIDIPNESFSPESMGTRNVSAESRARTIVGIIIVKM